jgi:hypothetical protein
VKRICMGLATLTFAVFGTATALAQPAAPAVKVETDSSDAKYVTPVLAGDMQEEVEILRRLFNDGFAAVYGRSPPLSSGEYLIHFGTSGGPPPMGSMTPGMPPARYSRAERPAPDLEGVYLKDYGVVYTVTEPPPPNQMSPGPSAAVVTRTPLSPWERTRKELRGEKIEDEGKGAVGSPSLSDVILKVLAENGKHFTRLAEGERITVAVTFRDDAANGISHPQSSGSSGSLSMSSSGAPPSMPGGYGSISPQKLYPGTAVGSSANARTPASPPGASTTQWAPDNEAAVMTDINNDLLLGDLHMKQQKPPEAIAAYQKAEKQLQSVLEIRTQMVPGDVGGILSTANLFNRLAKGFAAAGDEAASQKAMQNVGRLSKMAEQLTGGAPEASAKTQPPALPSKLVVTASKKLLDEVGSGKMTFEAFRKAATVEYVTPPAADKK